MKTFIHSRAYDDEGTYTNTVVAPDHETSLRMLAKEILDVNEWTLAGRGEKSLLEMSEDMKEIEDWTGHDGSGCCACASHDSIKLPTIDIVAMGIDARHEGRVHLCKSCGYAWMALGHHAETRRALESEAQKIVDLIDEYESKSLKEEE